MSECNRNFISCSHISVLHSPKSTYRTEKLNYIVSHDCCRIRESERRNVLSEITIPVLPVDPVPSTSSHVQSTSIHIAELASKNIVAENIVPQIEVSPEKFVHLPFLWFHVIFHSYFPV